MSGRLGVGKVLLGDGFVEGDLEVDGETITGIRPPAAGGLMAAAGFVDLQVNGHGGYDFATCSPEQYVAAAAAMAAGGVTAFQPTLVSLPWSEYAGAVERAATAGRLLGRRMLGLHLEGPFLSPQAAGAHDRSNLATPTPEALSELVSDPVVRQLTIAPELPGAMAAIQRLAAAGVRVAIGHSLATAEQASAALAAGASVVTHLFNAQSPLDHRRPGVPGAALDAATALLTLIVDGLHVAPELVRLVFRVAGHRTALITDAVAATGTEASATTLGHRPVRVGDGRAYLEDGTLAGSVLTMDRAVRTAVDGGVDPISALRAASTIPATFAGMSGGGELRPGARADVVVLDRDLRVARTLVGGRTVYER